MLRPKNVCKTFGCKNLGKINSADYTNFGNLTYCSACNGYFPHINHAIYQSNDNPLLNIKPKKTCCVNCGNTQLTRYGHTESATQRWQCSQCNRVFSFKSLSQKAKSRCMEVESALDSGLRLSQIKQKLGIDNRQLSRTLAQLVNWRSGENPSAMSNIETAMIIASDHFILPLRNGTRLYVIVSVEHSTRQVWGISSNYFEGDKTGDHIYQGKQAEHVTGDTLIDKIQSQDANIQKRTYFYDIDYGPASGKGSHQTCLIKPVYTSYWHFDILRSQLPSSVSEATLYIPFDCFLLGGCLTAFSDWITDKFCHVAYVYEEGRKTKGYQQVNKDIEISRWKDKWTIYESSDYNLGVCYKSLTPTPEQLFDVSLAATRQFIDYLKQHPFYPQLLKLSPKTVTLLLVWFAYRYNVGNMTQEKA